MEKGTINTEKACRVHLSAIIAKELLSAPVLMVKQDAVELADICIEQASASLSRVVAESDDDQAVEKIASLCPLLVQSVAHSILQSSILIHRNLMRHYEHLKTN